MFIFTFSIIRSSASAPTSPVWTRKFVPSAFKRYSQHESHMNTRHEQLPHLTSQMDTIDLTDDSAETGTHIQTASGSEDAEAQDEIQFTSEGKIK